MAVTAVSAAHYLHHHPHHPSSSHHQYLDISPHSVFSDGDLLFNSASSSSSSSTPAFFPDLSTPITSSATYPPVDPTNTPDLLFYDPLLIPSSMYPGDPALSATSYDNTLTTASAGYPGASSVDTSAIDWTALGCLPSGELPGNCLESQGEPVGSPDPPFDPSTHPTTTTLAPPTLSLPIQPHTVTVPATSTSVSVSVSASPMPSTTLQNPTPSPTRDSSSPKENPSRISKRQLNTMAARRYRQRRLDRMTQLEEELEAVKRERDELKMRVSKLEGETDALRSMLKEKNGN
ncbi:hypothetical protein BJX65DRAFT_311647 [Aspergillus insuetus]